MTSNSTKGLLLGGSLVLALTGACWTAPKKQGLLRPRPSANPQNPANSNWDRVWKALNTPSVEVPPSITEAGLPVRDGEHVVFRFQAPQGAKKVYLAGSFNGFANNNGGIVSDERFEMLPVGNGLFFKRARVEPRVEKYKYVVLGQDGKFQWFADPCGQQSDADGNTVLDFSKIAGVPNTRPLRAGRKLKSFRPLVASLASGKDLISVSAQKVWVRPDEANALNIRLGEQDVQPGTRLELNVLTPFGQSVYKATLAAKKGDNRLAVPALKREGGFWARIALVKAGRSIAQGEAVLSVVAKVADDLRYGFYTTYDKLGSSYDVKAAMLADLHINALEFYDYFPAHGYYAPREAGYKFEPFGTPINARDVQRKIEAGHKRNILSLAYVASYAASESIYRSHPFPMTNEQGMPKVFNGSIMSEAEADEQKKAKWFYLMDIAPGSQWYKYILEEFGRTVDNSPNDLVSFDGFELDTYGDSADAKFYAKNSPRNGDLLTDVLHDFVGDVQAQTHKIKPHGLVSFNSVNEFGAGKMGDVTDFLFLEIWDFYASSLGDIVDICTRNRAARQQRVILKLYPATMQPGHKVWPEATLRRLLGATMTGAGSLMVVGEPDETNRQMHALNTLYYPDHQPVPPENQKVLRDYYRFDALMYGWTHGKEVQNTSLENAVPGCITRTYAVPTKNALVVQLLNTGDARKWTVDTSPVPARKNLELALDLPGGMAPKTVLFASPDTPALKSPVALDFEVVDGKLRTQLPELATYGTVIFRY